MANRSYQTETREAAFRKWRSCGQNIQLTQKELKKTGYIISQPTLYDWSEKYNWKERAARAEAEEQKSNDAITSAEGKAIASLTKIQKRYEDYFEGLEPGARIDAQDVHAYKGVVTAIADIQAKTGAFKASLFLDFMRDLIDWLSKNDPDTVSAIEKNFDDFVVFAKEKYAT